MITAKTSVSKQEVLIEVLTETQLGTPAGRQTETTSIRDVEERLGTAYERAKEIIGSIATDFGAVLEKAAATDKVELEFSMGLSSTSGLWVISAKGECALKVKLTWERSR